jgi:hypothetical protein
VVFAALLGLGCCASVALSQVKLKVEDGPLSAADAAAFSNAQAADSFECNVTPAKPGMGIDLRFHTGYTVRVPLKSISGKGGDLQTIVRVTPVTPPGNPVVLAGGITAPPIDPESGGETEITGDYTVGPGEYRVDWLMRQNDSTCVKHWNIDAKLNHVFDQAPIGLPPGTVRESLEDPFEGTPASVSRAKHPLHVKVIVNFAPAGLDQPLLSQDDVRGITSIVRGIAREPQFGVFSLAAFSSESQGPVYHQDPGSHIDFPALGKYVHTLRSGVISIEQMEQPEKSAEYLSSLLEKEIGKDPAPDLVVVVSPAALLDTDIDKDELGKRVHPRFPVFFMKYNPDPVRNPWDGALGAAMKALHALEYTIAGPRDLGSAFRKMKSQLGAKD